ncbi:hypothetical protein [Candidatus Sulfurimonas baltica]|uniref:Uncharacterized protein n=1 Tax=Candidatus Sulfurimonas baltica TaxID=2740404 RepID=A0A7S7RLB5_9BACT|nr:hypothetical protein [Candidatus Sulfurimonas baltica]QOY50952.1 hypothetical protein HUE88_07285 [Candidatus Sulfurimonas baltica]
MQVDKTNIKNVYEIAIYDYEYGKLEFLRTYVILFNNENNVKSELEKLETICSGEELEIYLENEEYAFEYLVNYDPISTEEFLGKKETPSETSIVVQEGNIPF